jgi:cobalt/nickel transport system permease protein
MVEYPEIDRYSSLDSPMHRFDPRAKLIAFLVLIFSIVLLPNLKVALIGLLASILFLIASKLPLRFALQHIKWVFLFVVPFIVIMPFTVGGTEIFSFYGLTMTYEGLEYGILVAVRAISAKDMASDGCERVQNKNEHIRAQDDRESAGHAFCTEL